MDGNLEKTKSTYKTEIRTMKCSYNSVMGKLKKNKMRQLVTLIIITLFLTINLSRLFATSQIPDMLIYKGDTLSLFANPLEHFNGIDSLRTKFFGTKETCMSTACWRGYTAEWEIIDNQLYLIGIYSCCFYKDNIQADLKFLFGKKYKNKRVKADWFNGKVIAPKGKQIYYIHMGYSSLYETELEFNFEKGKLIETKVYDNSKSRQSEYSKDDKKLKEFIYSNINWDNLPKLEDKVIKVYVEFSANENGVVDSVKIVRKTDPIFEKEAIRVIKLIPDWDVFYRKEKHVRMAWNYPIIFNDENREKYKSIRK